MLGIVTAEGEEVSVEVAGDLDRESRGQFSLALEQGVVAATADGVPLVVDLEGCTFIDEHCVLALLAAGWDLHAAGRGAIRLRGATGQVAEKFELTRLARSPVIDV